MDNKEDILETALNSGIRYSAKQYNVSEKEVYSIVKEFKNEMSTEGGLCPCEFANKQRNCGMMCFMCSGPITNSRIII